MAHRVKICGVDTSTLPRLKSEECKELMIRLKKGDKEARERFINGNMRLVLSIVQRFKEGKNNSDDLFQVGCVGLLKAIENFDLSVGVMFSTYAVPMIIGEIKRFMRDSTSIKVSRNLRDVAYRALEARERLVREGKEGALFELAEELDVPERDIVQALDAVSEPVSLQAGVCGEGDDELCLIDQLGDEKNTDERWTESVALSTAIEGLKERERKIIEMRYFEGKTQTEISNEVGISQAQVSRLEKNALGKIKDNIQI